MSLPQLRVFTFAVIRGLMPLGVAQYGTPIDEDNQQRVIRGLMPLGVAQSGAFGQFVQQSGNSWLDAVRRYSIESLNTLVLPLVVLEGR